MDTLKLDYEAIGTVVALVTLIIALWKIQRSNAKEFQKMQDRTDSHETEIGNLKIADEKLSAKSDERVKIINGQIEALRSLHMNDVDKITAKIERTFERVQDFEEKHHKAVMGKIDNLNVKLTTVCATFEEYRKHE